ncbi:hypothetical protein [Yersinia mollaretii]|uniref:hypothetical protein n=1 Tax=Yersinia mollaretii TaxID=33060 RepID=UPI0011A33C42|nr:hypothetical protein [Yersinia mollaretii]
MTTDSLVNKSFDFIVAAAQAIDKIGLQSNNYGSVLTAIIVAIILFFIKEFVRSPPKLSGVFYLKSTTIESSYNPFKGMVLYHTLIIFSDGVIIEGTSEKTAEKDINKGDWLFVGKNRPRGKVTGRIERRYLRSHKINIHIEENGNLRVSSHYISLKRNNSFPWFFGRTRTTNTFLGEFFSSSADSKGTIICQASKFIDYPLQSSPSRYS